jgi:uncharacterized protein (DUF58 family)
MTGAGRARARSWLARFRPPRRLRLLRPGSFLLVGVIGLGLAALNTGNNLLYLLLGALLGTIVLSGWLSEESVRPLRVVRQLPRGATAGQPAWIRYQVRHGERRAAACAVTIREARYPGAAFLPLLRPGESDSVTAEHLFARRGVYRLEWITLATRFPFGLFLKERDIRQPAELVVWPRTDRPVRPIRRAGGRAPRAEPTRALPAAGERGSFRGLRPYRPGDEPRDVHWRSTARAGEPIIREFDRAGEGEPWFCLDTRGSDGADREEAAVEIAAALARTAAAGGARFGFSAGELRIEPAGGQAQLERVLDGLARLVFDPGALTPTPPAWSASAVLVTAGAAGGHVPGFSDVFSPDEA